VIQAENNDILDLNVQGYIGNILVSKLPKIPGRGVHDSDTSFGAAWPGFRKDMAAQGMRWR